MPLALLGRKVIAIAILSMGGLFPSLFAQDVIMQGFYWNSHPGDLTNRTTGGIWWDTLALVAPQLAQAGFSTVWTPPPTKGFAGVFDMGYGPYDYFDLGDFNSKGTTRTRHGSRSQLDNMISAMHANGLKVMADVVLNHRGGADLTMPVPYQVGGGSGFTVFNPPSGRIPAGPQHFHPNNYHPDQDPDYHNPIFFEDICYFNEDNDGFAIPYYFGSPTRMGSMGDSLITWGRWLVNEVGFDELRLDAVKHMEPDFVAKFLVETRNGAQPYALGESFDYGIANLENYLNAVRNSTNDGNVKNAQLSLFDFPLRGSLKAVLNNTSGTTDLYNTLGNAGLVWGSASFSGFDVVTWLDSHDTDRTGFVEAGAMDGCPIPQGAACLKLQTEPDHDPIFSDKEDMGYPFLMAAEGRPLVFWKDYYWYGLDGHIRWLMNLRRATATGSSDHIQQMGGFWPTSGTFDADNNGGNMFAMRRDGLSGGQTDGMVLGLNDHPFKTNGVYVNTPFTNKYLKDYSDGFMFENTQAFGDSRALIKAKNRDYTWYAPTGLYPAAPGTSSHFTMDATPGGCLQFITLRTVNAGNFIVNGAPIAVGDEVAIRNAAGQVVGIGRIGQGFAWDGEHDMVIEVLGGSFTTNGLADGEPLRIVVYDASAGMEVEAGSLIFSPVGTSFLFHALRPESPNRMNDIAVQTSAMGTYLCDGIADIAAFSTGGCSLYAVWPQEQSPCSGEGNTYTQDLLVYFVNPPAGEMLNVNGRLFTVASSPQLISLTGLLSDGAPVNIQAFFTNSTCTFAAEAVFIAPPLCSLPLVCTTSSAAAETYDTWQAGDNDDPAFGPWTLSSNDNAGHFVYLSTTNGDGDSNSDGDIDGGNRSWGLFANNGGKSEAVRPLATPLVAGTTFQMDMDNGWIETGGSVGFRLENAASNTLFHFYFEAGNSAYRIQDQAGVRDVTGFGFTDEGIHIEIDLLGSGNYEASITRLFDGMVFTISGTLISQTDQAVNQVRIYNNNAGNDGQHNAYFNNIQICVPDNDCAITGLGLGSFNTPCDPSTNTFGQQLSLSYANPPGIGKLVVNGQFVDITTSPQLFVLENIPADGQPKTVTAYFSALPSCSLTMEDLVPGQESCAPCQITQVTPLLQTACEEATQTYTQQVQIFYTNAPAGGSLSVNGQTFLATSSPQVVTLTNLPADNQAVNVTVGFVGESCNQEYPQLFTAPSPCPPCEITNVSAGSQSACSPLTNTYTQELVITYAYQPTDGFLVVNGQHFPITGSPQTVTLGGLPADGQAVMVTVSFSSEQSCTFEMPDAFIAPEGCLEESACVGDDITSSTYVDGWQSGDDGGYGFGPWLLTGSANSGQFIFTSTANGDGNSNGDADIDVNNQAFGMYANSNTLAEAIRPFASVLPFPAQVNFHMDNGWIENNGSVGWGLRNANGQNMLEFFFRGGDPSYTLSDGNGIIATAIPFTDEGLTFSLTLLTSSTYELRVQMLDGGFMQTFVGSFIDPGPAADLRFFNFNAGFDGQRNVYMNSFGICLLLPDLAVTDTVTIAGVDVGEPQNCGAFEMTLDVTVKNTGDAALDELMLRLDLATPDAFGPAFGGVVVPPVFVADKTSSAAILPNLNPTYAGTGELFDGTSGGLQPLDSLTVRLTILVNTTSATTAVAKSEVWARGNYGGSPLWDEFSEVVLRYTNDATETAVGNCPALSCGLTAHKDVTVTMDENCGACITASMLIPSHDASCELPLGGYYQILIEGYGTFSDTVCLRRDMFQTEKVKFLVRSVACACDPVWGYLHLEDKTGPQVDPPATAEFYCMEVDRVLNVSSSWLDGNYQWFAGKPTLTDNCCPASSLKLKVSDEIHYNDCAAINQTGVYAYITRTFIGVDCYGNETAAQQTINFVRPDVRGHFGVNMYQITEEISKTVCDGNVDVAAVMKERLTWEVRGVKYNLFDLQCNFSTTIAKTVTFPVCGTGRKIEVKVEIFDWCAGGVIAAKTFLIKAYDNQPPTIAGTGGELSTGPMDCTATLGLDDASLEKALGVKVTDNCSANITKSYKVESRDIVLYGIPVDQGDYLPANYPIITVGGKKTMIGIPLGRHRLLIEAFDGCYNTATATVYFEVVDKVAPVMKCDDKLNVTLTRTPGDYYAGDKGIVYGKASVADVDEGSFDNCTLTSMKVRRIVSKDCLESGYFDGNWDYDLNNDKNIRNDFTEIKEGPHKGSYYSPLLDYVEFFCCDLGSDVVIELWGEDNNQNRSYCWLEIHLEDKVTPSCTAPATQYVKCTDKETRAKIYDEIESNKIWGAPLITGLECTGRVEYAVDSSLHCDAGYYIRSWTAIREVKGVEVKSKLCEQKVVVLAVHEYDIHFPEDVEVYCGDELEIPGVTYTELGCDVLAVNVKDSEYFADSEGEACYKLFRTYTVINWCEFEEWQQNCTDAIDPANFAQIVPRHPEGEEGPASGVTLWVRDEEADNSQFRAGEIPGMNGVEEYYLSFDPFLIDYERVSPYRTPNQNRPGYISYHFAFDDNSWENFCGPLTNDYGNEERVPTFAWQYTQIIKVFDDIPPTVEVPELDKFATDPETCVAKVTIPFVANDSCGGAAVKVNLDRVQVAPGQSQTTLLNPATFQSNWTLANGTMRTATGFSVTIANLPEGTHDLLVTVRDDCGNVTVKRIPFTVADCKGPAPTCIEGLTMPLMPTPEGEGMMAVWATDFIASPIYDCNGQGEVNPANSKQKKVTKFSINRVGEDVDETQTGIVLSCADFLTNPKVAVEIHAWDTKGNHSFCTTYVQLTDPNGLCTAGPSAAIAGIIQTEGKAEVEGVDVSLSGGAAKNYATSLNGQYQFQGLTTGADYTVAPKLNKGFLNGVSTFDLVLLQKHILNVQPITSPYKLIAADANNSRTITTLDMIQLRKLILNIDRELANNTSWRFVDASFTFPNPANPWQTPFPEVKNINNLTGEQRANFVGIKIGDLNGNAVANSTMASVRSFQGNWTITTDEQQLTAGNEYRIEFTAPTSQIEGYQFTLNFDQTKVELIDIESGIAQDEHFGVFAEEGMITTSWNGEAQDGRLFSLILRARADATLSEVINLNSRFTPAEAYQGSTLLNVGLAFSQAIQPQGQFGLYQNIPNPFQGQTLIGFTLPEASDATITIQDVTGRTLRVIKGQYAKGYNEIRLTRTDISRNVASAGLPTTGVLYYTLTAGSQTATRKMVIVE
ncbi:MAG: T9SS type A sorting domain-containing protein [Lewinellaceae bacterium]|nr:T9SS type A sorting domain-containing protein [Lewinellaceae bacterium]